MPTALTCHYFDSFNVDVEQLSHRTVKQRWCEWGQARDRAGARARTKWDLRVDRASKASMCLMFGQLKGYLVSVVSVIVIDMPSSRLGLASFMSDDLLTPLTVFRPV
jgi:hypothetical protein